MQLKVAELICLQGLWSQVYFSFLWQGVKIFRKSASENSHDYWVAYASGACLASSALYMSARYDPSTFNLNFNPRGNSRVDGPWKLLFSPLNSTEQPQQMALFTQSGLRVLEKKIPNLFETGWIDPVANEELMKLATADNRAHFGEFGSLRIHLDRQDSVLEDEKLPHGAMWAPSYLLSIDENELNMDKVLQSKAKGRLITDSSTIIPK